MKGLYVIIERKYKCGHYLSQCYISSQILALLHYSFFQRVISCRVSPASVFTWGRTFQGENHSRLQLESEQSQMGRKTYGDCKPCSDGGQWQQPARLMSLLCFILSPPGIHVFVEIHSDWEKEKRRHATPHLSISFLTTAHVGTGGAVAHHKSFPKDPTCASSWPCISQTACHSKLVHEDTFVACIQLFHL